MRGKAFASHQALGVGGHKSSSSGGERWAAPVRRLPEGARHGSGARRPHALPLAHYWYGMSAPISVSVSTSVVRNRVVRRHRLGSDFDLNLTPLPENDAGMMKRWAEERGEVQSPSPIKNRRVSDY